MKVGTDAVLLGAWADLDGATRILDIGTGSGIIALIAAQRAAGECLIDGIEIQSPDCAQAIANVAASPWSDRIQIVNTPVQAFAPPYHYDVILCNPPYFSNSLLSPASGRTIARHTVTLDYEDLAAACARLLSLNGTVSVILPAGDGAAFTVLMNNAGFVVCRSTAFRARPGKKTERILLAFRRSRMDTNPAVQRSELELYGAGDEWSPAYRQLTGTLYLPRKPLQHNPPATH